MTGSDDNTRLDPVGPKLTAVASETPSGLKMLNVPPDRVASPSETLIPEVPATPSNSTRPTFPPERARTRPGPPIAIRAVATTSAAACGAGTMNRSSAVVAVPSAVIAEIFPPVAVGMRLVEVAALAEIT